MRLGNNRFNISDSQLQTLVCDFLVWSDDYWNHACLLYIDCHWEQYETLSRESWLTFSSYSLGNVNQQVECCEDPGWPTIIIEKWIFFHSIYFFLFCFNFVWFCFKIEVNGIMMKYIILFYFIAQSNNVLLHYDRFHFILYRNRIVR